MNWIDWTGTVIGTLFFAMLHHLQKNGHRLPGRWVIKSALALLGGVFLAFSIIGVLVEHGLALLPTVVVGGLLLFALFVAFVDISSDRKADKLALIALASMAILFISTAAPIAKPGADGVTAIHDGIASQIGTWLGGSAGHRAAG